MLVAQKDVVDDAPADSTADLNAMFDDVNSLPADDPLRMPANAAAGAVSGGDTSVAARTAPMGGEQKQGVLDLLPAKVVDAFQASGGAGSAMTNAGDMSAHLSAAKDVSPVQLKEKGAVVVNAGLRVPVPSFEGAGLRSVVERADAVGLRVQAVGSGLAREQVPVAGTMVPAGTEVVVRFVR
jgi:cell division protein FtsI (penicillin-binding protein 3)